MGDTSLADGETDETNPGLANARDAGAATGLRPGVLLRSDAPWPGDPAPAGLPWPPGTVVDLRSAPERKGPHPLDGPATHVEHLPLNEALAPEAQVRWGGLDMTLPGLYVDLLESAPRWLPTLVHLAADGAGPVLVHCAAGKDRTGITVAVLLATAGADLDAIVADYLRTNDVLPALMRRLDRPGRLEAPDHMLDAPRAAITGALDRLGSDPVGWCRRQGVPATDLQRWQERIRP